MKPHVDQWEKAQKFEIDWWGDCINTYGEEEKQLVYAEKMGLKFFHNGKSPYNIDLEDKLILDIGGGASSLLLKTVNRQSGCLVVDPIFKSVPRWVIERYVSGNIATSGIRAEDIDKLSIKRIYDEVWIYNCLQHTQNPKKIIRNARRTSRIIRIFEWIDTHPNEGHPHELSEEKLNQWLGGEGKTEVFNHYTLRGTAYYGVFKGDYYEA